MKKNNVFYGILEKLSIFLRPIYDNGSSLTTEERHRPKIYEPMYSKSKSSNTTGENVVEGIL